MTRRRPGLSMTEVLVALFIMGLGTIAILTLFPLGAINMAQALKDDRTTQAANQAEAYMRWYFQANAVEGTPGAEPFVRTFDNPNDTTGIPPAELAAFQATPATSLALPILPGEASYPVVVDPMGWVARRTASKFWCGLESPANYQRLPRRNMSLVTRPDQALRVCSLLDGLTFDPSQGGQPIDPATGNVDREYRYNWLWVLQRMRNDNPGNVNVTVVVFDKRTHQFVPDKAEFAFTGVAFTPGSTTVTVPTTPGVVLQKGGWVMDATIKPADLLATPPTPAMRHANFYRIVSATENGANIDLELDKPIRRNDGRANPTLDAWTDGTLVVLAGVADVFEQQPMTAAPFLAP